jgi:hypothetical protein
MCDDYAKQNPYGVPIATGGWGGSGNVVNFAATNYYASQFYPDIINSEYVYKGLNYIFGCHPYSNISFVSSVGTKSKKNYLWKITVQIFILLQAALFRAFY